MKKYRNENGKLTMSIEEIIKKTRGEAMDYYRPSKIYLNAEDGKEYIYLIPVPGDGGLAHFQSFEGDNLFIPIDNLGTFLPDVAAYGMELTIVE